MSVHLAVDGPLYGFNVVDLDLRKFEDFKQRCYDAHVGYLFGAKDPNPGSGRVDFAAIDCSGFVRTLLDYASDGATSSIPDGSWMEDDWFAKGVFKRTAYSECGAGDAHVRVAVHRPGGRGGDATGHIWLTVNGHSVESYGGHGPGERPWDHPWFLAHVDDCYVLC
jgi:hypothetical protein